MREWVEVYQEINCKRLRKSPVRCIVSVRRRHTSTASSPLARFFMTDAQSIVCRSEGLGVLLEDNAIDTAAINSHFK